MKLVTKIKRNAVLRRLFIPLRRVAKRYFSEVEYVSRFFNYSYSFVAQYSEISERRKLSSELQLSGDDASTLEALLKNSIAKLQVSAFFNQEDLLKTLEKKAKEFGEIGPDEVARHRAGFSKNYWVNLFNREDPEFKVLVDFAYQPRIIALVSKYLGQIPSVQRIDYFYSPPQEESKALIGSQSWHLDNDQRTRVKIFLSPYSVDKNCGPTTCLPLAESNHALYPNYPDYFNDDEGRKSGLNIDKKFEMVSVPGEFYMADTSKLFHYGARGQLKPRWLVIISYGPLESNLRPKGWRKNSDFALENQRLLEALRSKV